MTNSKFRLTRKSANRLVVTYHVTNHADDTIGSVNISPGEEADFLRSWSGATDRGQSQATPKLSVPRLMPMSRARVATGGVARLLSEPASMGRHRSRSDGWHGRMV
jgi:hypothetical protein